VDHFVGKASPYANIKAVPRRPENHTEPKNDQGTGMLIEVQKMAKAEHALVPGLAIDPYRTDQIEAD
jgi:hypothetical protein